jgi:hypothetical protein
MAASFPSKDSAVLGVQLKVQELILTLADVSVLSTSGSTATVNVQENFAEIRSCTFIKDSTATASVINAANRAISGSSVVLTLPSAMAAGDVISLRYVIKES